MFLVCLVVWLSLILGAPLILYWALFPRSPWWGLDSGLVYLASVVMGGLILKWSTARGWGPGRGSASE